jgi:hypothetical protein
VENGPKGIVIVLEGREKVPDRWFRISTFC